MPWYLSRVFIFTRHRSIISISYSLLKISASTVPHSLILQLSSLSFTEDHLITGVPRVCKDIATLLEVMASSLCYV